MLDMGYKQVGKDFPIVSSSRYARRIRLGAYRGEKSSQATMDLKCTLILQLRLSKICSERDLTINAIAEDDNGQIIDHFNGVEDLKNKVLRHVSVAFSEDPLRLVRLCRFPSKVTCILRFIMKPSQCAKTWSTMVK